VVFYAENHLSGHAISARDIGGGKWELTEYDGKTSRGRTFRKQTATAMRDIKDFVETFNMDIDTDKHGVMGRARSAAQLYAYFDDDIASLHGSTSVPAHWVSKRLRPTDYQLVDKRDLAGLSPENEFDVGMTKVKGGNIDDLYWSVNTLYELVDDGYLDGSAVMDAFR
jgi:hypothetical protein